MRVAAALSHGMTYRPLAVLCPKADGMTAQKFAARIRAGPCEPGSYGAECCVLFGGGPDGDSARLSRKLAALLRGPAQGQVLYVVM